MHLEARGIRSPGVGRTGHCEQPYMSSQNWTGVFYTSNIHNSEPLIHLFSPAPNPHYRFSSLYFSITVTSFYSLKLFESLSWILATWTKTILIRGARERKQQIEGLWWSPTTCVQSWGPIPWRELTPKCCLPSSTYMIWHVHAAQTHMLNKWDFFKKKKKCFHLTLCSGSHNLQ